MVSQELIDCLNFGQFDFQFSPVGLQHLHSGKSQDLLHESQHSSSENEYSGTPVFKFGMFLCGYPPVGRFVVNPHGCEHLLDVFEMQQEAKEKLIAQNCFAGNNQRKRESNVVVQC